MSRSVSKPGSMRRHLLRGGGIGLIAASALGLFAVAPGCLDRPVSPQQPNTVRLSTQLYRATKIDKIDLLFVIDNSMSMADKQLILADAVPDLVGRLIEPACLDQNLNPAYDQKGDPIRTAGDCPQPLVHEFDPVKNIHIGVTSSSLGGHGSSQCAPGSGNFNPRLMDMAHLITRSPADPNQQVPNYKNQGFLWWDPDRKFGGESDPVALKKNFTDIVMGVGQDGCGYEATQEGWYRFLVDPNPYKSMDKCDLGGGVEGRCPAGIDDVVLSQRHAFMRSDSLLAVIVLSDENDCSVIDLPGQSYLALQPGVWHPPRGTSGCWESPNDPNKCKICQAAPADPACAKGGPFLSEEEDSTNLRCYRQKQRFGIDWLWPVKRYVNGLTKIQFTSDDVQSYNPGFYPSGANGTGGDLNPLFCVEYAKMDDPNNPGSTIDDRSKCQQVLRDQKLVFYGAIVGVPWQDIAMDPNDLKKGYRPVQELSWKQGDYDTYNKTHPDDVRNPAPGVNKNLAVWDFILGGIDPVTLNPDPAPGADPQDPLMVEDTRERGGTNPALNAPLAPSGASSPTANPINGHEWVIAKNNDLQYACVFKLAKSRDCSLLPGSCDCVQEAVDGKNPLCQSDSNGAYSLTQYRAKAYPGRRHLAVAHGVDPKQAIVASICPANADLARKKDADYGYSPAIRAIVDRLKAVLQGTCWGQKLPAAADGTVQCVVLEASKVDGACPACDSLSVLRLEPNDEAKAALAKDSNYISNGLNCVCQIPQAELGDALNACIGSLDKNPPGVDGWCYVDGNNPSANASLVRTCPKDQKQMIRFVGTGNPQSGTLTFLQCKGAVFELNPGGTGPAPSDAGGGGG